MAILNTLSKYKDFGLLLIRIGLGAMMVYHGFPKLNGGPEKWTAIGSAMSTIGVHFFPLFWGLMAALAETVGGLFFVIGLWFRPTVLFLAFTMLIAALKHLLGGDGLFGASHAIELFFVFIGLFFIGAGKYAVDKESGRRR